MSAGSEMPYFIKPSLNLSQEEKVEAYDLASQGIHANISPQDGLILKMVTINCLLKTYLPYYYWVGFYIYRNNRLEVGPYQGTLGCLYIDMDKGVCGKAGRTKQTQIIDDVHALQQGTDHIACDLNSQSEICIPILDKEQNLIAVFDVDSTIKGSFDETDKAYLENLLQANFSA